MGAGAACDGLLPGALPHSGRLQTTQAFWVVFRERGGAGAACDELIYAHGDTLWRHSVNLFLASPPRLPQPQEFIDAVRRDRLASLFALLERQAAGQRPYILVCGLARHIDAQERKQHRSDMRAGAMVGDWGALGRRYGC